MKRITLHITAITAVTACILMAAAETASAQTALTVERCRQLAVENNKQMAVAAAQSEKAEYDTKAYRANFLPNLSATGNYLFTSSTMKKRVAGGYLPTFVPDAGGQLVPNILTTVDGVPLFREYAYFPDMDLELKLNGTYTAGLRLEQPVYMGGKIASAYRMARVGGQIAELNREKTRAEVILQSDR